MSRPGSEAQPLRVAIIGSGPAGFYVADHLAKSPDLTVQIDMIERSAAPFGLVRFGVAPDHHTTKRVSRAFQKVASGSNFRYYGNVEFGKDVSIEDLRAHFHQVCFATGAQTDRRLGIPGEDLSGSHSATEFVAWYNGDPDYRDRRFDLSVERVAVIGVGLVAVDVARILCRTVEELSSTDMADHALEALRHSRVKEVCVLGRRGPVQASFTPPEIKELGEMQDADVLVLPEEMELDELSKAELERSESKQVRRKVEILQSFAGRTRSNKPRGLTLRFMVSPVELMGDDAGRVVGMRVVRNVLYASEDGGIRARATQEFEELRVGLVFRSVGYRGVPLPGVPFSQEKGIVPNEKGRVVEDGTAHRVVGLYASGWIKRGPKGVIGTNKTDAAETVRCMLEDLSRDEILRPAHPEPGAMEALVGRRQPDFISYVDWLRLDELETGRGKEEGRPRVKFTRVEEMLAALDRRPS